MIKLLSNFFCFMQMAHVGIHFNYEKTYQRNCLYCTGPMVTAFAIMLISTTTDVNNYIYNDSIVFIQRSMSHISAMSFLILLHGLYERFDFVNSYLRQGQTFSINVLIFSNSLKVLLFVPFRFLQVGVDF